MKIFTVNISIIKNNVKNIFISVFPEINEVEFNWDHTPAEYENWDSFAHLRLVSQIEKKFNLQFEFDDSINLNSASDFLKLTLKILNSS